MSRTPVLVFLTDSPTVLIHNDDLAATGLIQPGKSSEL